MLRCSVGVPSSGVDLLAQHRALEGAAGFALFLQRQAGGQHGVRQQQGSGFGVGQAGLAEVLAWSVAFSRPAKKSETWSRPR